MALQSLGVGLSQRFFHSASKKLLGCSSIIQDTGFFHQTHPGDSEGEGHPGEVLLDWGERAKFWLILYPNFLEKEKGTGIFGCHPMGGGAAREGFPQLCHVDLTEHRNPGLCRVLQRALTNS